MNILGHTLSPEQLVYQAKRQLTQARPANGDIGPSAELAAYIEGVTSGRIFPVELPWPTLHSYTYALMPGAVMVICGDPGVGKTYWLLDCLRFWTEHKVDAAVYFLEEDRKFYLRRLLAQLEGKAEYTRIDWWQRNVGLVKDAMKRHAAVIDELGARITVAGDLKQIELRRLTGWLESELKSGRRVVAIDPITAAYAGADRWLADDAFVTETKALVTRYDASLILVTHPRKGNVTQKSGHDMANGAAYFRFSSTTVWLNRTQKPKRYDVLGPHGPTTADTDLLVEIHKAREGKGRGQQIAMKFGDGLRFAECGVVLRESDEAAADESEKPMRREEMDEVVQKITRLYPLKLNQEQGNALRRAFARYSFRTAERVIDAYYFNESSVLDVSKLTAQLDNL